VRIAGRWASWLALGGYVLVAFLFFGLPALGHPGRTYVGLPNGDPELEIWAFAWWPHAILHGENPFVTHAIWAPTGVSLAWPTMAPGLVLAFAPLTLLLGAVASFDVASVLMPALAAWTAFLLCRHLTRSFWPALAGGYLFGFSAYVLGQLQGHIQLSAVFLIPLAALVVIRFVEGELSGRGLAWRLGLLLGLELTLSTEIAFTLTLGLALSLVLAFLLVPAARARLRSILLPVVAAFAIGALVASPLLYFMLTNFHKDPFNPQSPTQYSADLLNAVVPSNLEAVGWRWAHGIASHFTAFETEQGAYYGLPALAIVVWFAWRRRRDPVARFLVVAVAVGIFLSLGSWLHVRGRQVVTLPWEHLSPLPLFSNVLTVRFSMYVSLGIAVIVALWAASSTAPRWARIALPVLAIVAIAPHLQRSSWATTTRVPAFIDSAIYKRCLRRGDRVLVFPAIFHGNSMLWQAEAGFRFRMANGYVAAIPPRAFLSPPGVGHLAEYGELPGTSVAPLREYVKRKGVTAILVEKGPEIGFTQGHWVWLPNRWPGIVGQLAKPQDVGGLLLYRLDGSASCRP
jgi:hypothetical protein